MTAFFNDNTRKKEAFTLDDAFDVVARIDDLIVKTDKAAALNKNEYNLSAVSKLLACREALMGIAKAPVSHSIPVETDNQVMEQSMPRFGK